MAQLTSEVTRFVAAALVIGMAIAGIAPSSSGALVAYEEQAIRSVPRISIDELKALMEQNAVLVLDVRDPESFAKGRIPGAVNVDYTQVLKQADRFANEKRTIVTYCACANEMTAARASVDLAAKGIAGAKALRGGWDEWVQRGEKIER